MYVTMIHSCTASPLQLDSLALAAGRTREIIYTPKKTLDRVTYKHACILAIGARIGIFRGKCFRHLLTSHYTDMYTFSLRI